MRQLTPTQLTGSSKATWAGRRLDTIAIGLKQLSNQKNSFRFERDLKEIEKCFHSNFENDHLCRIESVFFGKRMVCWGIMALACEEHITRLLRMNTAKDIRTRNSNLFVIPWLMCIYVCVFGFVNRIKMILEPFLNFYSNSECAFFDHRNGIFLRQTAGYAWIRPF